MKKKIRLKKKKKLNIIFLLTIIHITQFISEEYLKY